ncbi:MAG: hypothetical protein RLZZ516_1929, partial [Cyanobacteriota bacterium]
ATSLITDQPGTAALNGNIDVNGSGGVQINELAIGINDNLSINSTQGPVTLSSSGGALNSEAGETNNLSITASNNKDVTFNASIGNTQSLGDILVNTGGATVFNAAVNAVSLTTDAPGTAVLGGNISLSGPGGAQINEAIVTLNGPVTINTTTGNGPVQFGGNVDSKIGTSNNLTVQAGSGAISFVGSVGGTTLLNNLNLSGGTITMDGPTQAWNVAMQATNLNLNANIISPGYGTPGVSYGNHTFAGTVNLTGPITIQGNIGTLNGTRLFTGTEMIGGFVLSYFYNPDPPPQPDNNNNNNNRPGSNSLQIELPFTASNLLTYQANENSNMQAGSTTTGLQGMMNNSSTGRTLSGQSSGDNGGIDVNLNSPDGSKAAFINTNQQVCTENPTCTP